MRPLFRRADVSWNNGRSDKRKAQLYPRSSGIEGWLWAGFALIGSFLVSYTRARAESAGCRKLSVGIAERTERMLILALGALSGFLGWALVLIAIFSHITIIQRVLRAKSILSKLPNPKSRNPEAKNKGKPRAKIVQKNAG